MDQREEYDFSDEQILIEMKRANIILSVIAILLMATPFIQQNASAQVTTDGKSSTVDGKVRFDKVVHDFGDVLESDGALKCEFTVEKHLIFTRRDRERGLIMRLYRRHVDKGTPRRRQERQDQRHILQ